jgi:hypothetical protein
MSVNRYKPYVMVLPEDRANRQLANGFLLALDQSVATAIQVLPEVGGWNEVLERFLSDHVAEMERFRGRFMVLLIDFDRKTERLDYAKGKIPEQLKERVFVLGAWTEPEDLKDLGSYETTGKAMATDCREGTDTAWGHDLLRHNAGEIARLREHVRPILFLPPKPVQ